jgi:hypothetical protein
MSETFDNTAEALRQLLLEIYTTGLLWDDGVPESERQRLLDTVLDAAEGRAFKPLGLPFPMRDS